VNHGDRAITYLGRTTYRNAGVRFGIRQQDRFTHMYIIGKTGTGKSTLLKTIAMQDIAAGRGLALFDPHGDLVRDIVEHIRRWRQTDVVYINVPDTTCVVSFNPLAGIPRDQRPLAASTLLDVFKTMWPDDWGPRLEHLLRNVLFTLLELPDATLADIPRLLADKDFRKDTVDLLENDIVKDYWTNEYDKYSPAFRAVVTAPLYNKVGALLTNPILRRILTGTENRLDLRKILDEGKVLLVNLDKGRIGEDPAVALGSFLVSHLCLAGLSRSDIREENRSDYIVFLDEFQTFATESLAVMLAELRKYRVACILAHQYLTQLDTGLRDAVFGNVGSIISFRISALDAHFVAREFAPNLEATDFIRLRQFRIYLRVSINGAMSEPFSAETFGSFGKD
jgi:hypothetical protein